VEGAFYGVVERRYGFNINEHALTVRKIIEDYPYSMQDQAHEAGLALEDMPEMCEQDKSGRYEYLGDSSVINK